MQIFFWVYPHNPENPGQISPEKSPSLNLSQVARTLLMIPADHVDFRWWFPRITQIFADIFLNSFLKFRKFGSSSLEKKSQNLIFIQHTIFHLQKILRFLWPVVGFTLFKNCKRPEPIYITNRIKGLEISLFFPHYISQSNREHFPSCFSTSFSR